MNCDYVTFAQGARTLGVDPRTLDRIAWAGGIKVVRISRTRRKINLPQLMRWIESGGHQAGTAQTPAPDSTGAEAVHAGL